MELNNKVTAIFGSAFSPIHNDHIKIINELLKTYDKVVLVPSYCPPHKSIEASFKDRCNMLNLLFKNNKRVIIDNIEHDAESTHYAVDVLPKLKDKYGDIVYVIGADSLYDLNKWKTPNELIKICPFIVVPRYSNISDEANDKLYSNEKQLTFEKKKLKKEKKELKNEIEKWNKEGGDFRFLDIELKGYSSTYTRELISHGVFFGVDEKIKKYIIDKKLYSYKVIERITRLNTIVSQKRIDHMVRVYETAMAIVVYNNLIGNGVEYDEVYDAAMLHDVAKNICDTKHILLLKIPRDSYMTPIEHQFYGAYLAKESFNITNTKVLNAIKYHSTAKKLMPILAKVIYLADLVEPARDFGRILDLLRDTMIKSYDAAFKIALIDQYAYLVENGSDIYPLTTEAYKFYKK